LKQVEKQVFGELCCPALQQVFGELSCPALQHIKTYHIFYLSPVLVFSAKNNLSTSVSVIAL
jgi:hypothetical protein